MAELNIKLIFNTLTGKKDILIDYESDKDALPIEHEMDHKMLIEKLLGKGILEANEVGEVIVSRDSEMRQPAQEEELNDGEMEERHQ